MQHSFSTTQNNSQCKEEIPQNEMIIPTDTQPSAPKNTIGACERRRQRKEAKRLLLIEHRKQKKQNKKTKQQSKNENKNDCENDNNNNNNNNNESKPPQDDYTKQKKNTKSNQKQTCGDEDSDVQVEMKSNLRKKWQKKDPSSIEFCGQLIFDCNEDFQSKMSTKQMSSLFTQLMFAYAHNLKMEKPFEFFVTGMADMSKFPPDCNAQAWLFTHFCKNDYLSTCHFQNRKKDLVYLTYDAEKTLKNVRSDQVYIIGGLVDRNAFPKICWNKAQNEGIKTRRLPIQEHLQLNSTGVITVNLVAQILMTFVQTKDWKITLETVFPKRKVKETQPKPKKMKSENQNFLQQNE